MCFSFKQFPQDSICCLPSLPQKILEIYHTNTNINTNININTNTNTNTKHKYTHSKSFFMLVWWKISLPEVQIRSTPHSIQILSVSAAKGGQLASLLHAELATSCSSRFCHEELSYIKKRLVYYLYLYSIVVVVLFQKLKLKYKLENRDIYI